MSCIIGAASLSIVRAPISCYFQLEQETSSWPPLLTLAKQKKFREIVHILTTTEKNGNDVLNWLMSVDGSTTQSREFNLFMGETVLHSIMRYRPPLDVVELMIRRLGEVNGINNNNNIRPEEVVDSEGRTPLHVAAASGCDIPVILRLMGKFMQPAYTLDFMNRYPLHWACTNPLRQNSMLHSSRRGSGSGSGSTMFQSFNKALASLMPISTSISSQKKDEETTMTQIISALVMVYPVAVSVSDIDGKTPLQLARENNLSPTVIRLLESVAVMGVDGISNKTCTKGPDQHDTRIIINFQSNGMWAQSAMMNSLVQWKECLSSENAVDNGIEKTFDLPIIFINENDDDDDDDDDDISSIGMFSINMETTRTPVDKVREKRAQSSIPTLRRSKSNSPCRKSTIRKSLSAPDLVDLVRLEI